MKRVLVFCLVVGIAATVSGCWLVPDRWELKGTWQNMQETESERTKTMLTFDGDFFAIEVYVAAPESDEFVLNDGYRGAYSLDSRERPKEIDVDTAQRYLPGGDGFWIDYEEKLPGIYQIDDCEHIQLELNLDGVRPIGFGEDARRYTRASR